VVYWGSIVEGAFFFAKPEYINVQSRSSASGPPRPEWPFRPDRGRVSRLTPVPTPEME
jgi:hypothetical protein